jgi:hypothetical protein
MFVNPPAGNAALYVCILVSSLRIGSERQPEAVSSSPPSARRPHMIENTQLFLIFERLPIKRAFAHF